MGGRILSQGINQCRAVESRRQGGHSREREVHGAGAGARGRGGAGPASQCVCVCASVSMHGDSRGWKLLLPLREPVAWASTPMVPEGLAWRRPKKHSPVSSNGRGPCTQAQTPG